MSLVKKLASSGAIVAVTAFVTAGVVSGGDPKPTDAMPPMTPEMQKMMENWIPYMTPGKEHAAMAKHAGKWTMATKMRFTADSPWQEGTGTAEMKAVMGGRYMFESVKSPPDATMPEGFEGFNIAGYDNFKQKYIFCWIDSMGTGFMNGEGTASADGKTITYQCEGPDFVTKTMKKIKFVTVNVDDNTIKAAMYETGSDGKEFQTFESTYTRAK